MQKIQEIIRKYKSQDILIFAHADHDGICATAGLNYLFGNLKVIFSQSFMPKKMPPLCNKKLLIICDLQLNEKNILELLENGMEIIDLDHHEIKNITHSRYHCFNPKKLYNKQFISSSGLIWKLFRPSEISWVLGVGSAGDLAIEDVADLFEQIAEKFPELLSSPEIKTIYNSKIFELAQILLMSFDNPEEGLELVRKSIEEGYNKIYESKFYSEYLKKQNTLSAFLNKNKSKIIEDKNFVLIDSSNQLYVGSYSVKLNLENKDKRAYIEYCNGRLFFRNYFGSEDVRALAKQFGGGGPHARTGGAFTKKSFAEVLNLIKEYFKNKAQQKLFI
ncbi:MAG: DHH family phosphoesterase [Candidatus Woesearchaeota archaeon]